MLKCDKGVWKIETLSPKRTVLQFIKKQFSKKMFFITKCPIFVLIQRFFGLRKSLNLASSVLAKFERSNWRIVDFAEIKNCSKYVTCCISCKNVEMLQFRVCFFRLILLVIVKYLKSQSEKISKAKM